MTDKEKTNKERIELFKKVTPESEAFCLGFAYGEEYGYTQEYPVAGKLPNPEGSYIIAKSLYDKLKNFNQTEGLE